MRSKKIGGRGGSWSLAGEFARRTRLARELGGPGGEGRTPRTKPRRGERTTGGLRRTRLGWGPRVPREPRREPDPGRLLRDRVRGKLPRTDAAVRPQKECVVRQLSDAHPGPRCPRAEPARAPGRLAELAKLLAANNAGELVKARLGAAVGIPETSLPGYLELLETLYLIHQIPAWGNNLSGRVTGRAKVALLDTGLAAD